MKITPLNYAVGIDYSPEDKCFVARVPALKYCTAHGETYEEAAREIQTAIEGWIEIAREKGTPIPVPGPDIEDLRAAADLLNLTELARKIGMNKQTLFAKVRRGSKLDAKEAMAVARALNEAGLHLVAEAS